MRGLAQAYPVLASVNTCRHDSFHGWFSREWRVWDAWCVTVTPRVGGDVGGCPASRTVRTVRGSGHPPSAPQIVLSTQIRLSPVKDDV